MDNILEQAKYEVALNLRKSVAGILDEWKQPSGKRKPLGLFLEFNFPFLTLKVQKILKKRDPNAKAATQWLKDNPS